MSWDLASGVRYYHFCHILLVVQTNSDTFGEGVPTMRHASLGALLKTGYC